MNQSRMVMAGMVAACMLSVPSFALPLPGIGGPPPGFQVFSVDDQGGGWVIHHMGGRGDTLWGCADLTAVDECQQVYFNEWKTATKLEFLHVTDATQMGWLKLSAPGMGDYLLACTDPEGAPSCTAVDLELRPPLASYKRIWPNKHCASECDEAFSSLPEWDARRIIGPQIEATMWLQVGTKIGGSLNLYACRNLDSTPECELTLPNWLALDRENIGFKKLEDIENEADNGSVTYGPGVMISKLNEGSVAWDAGLRETMIITKVGDYEVNRAKHARYLMLQFPANDGFMVTLQDGRELEIKARRKPKKK
jgi:hypothetical protein